MNSIHVLNKSQNYQLWQSGVFGNKLRAWRTLEEWRASGFTGLVVLRTLMGGGGLCRYNLNPLELEALWQKWVFDGIPADKIMINEAAPDEQVILQGEYLNDVFVINGSAGWGYFYYSRHRAQMRDALRAAPEKTQNLRADLLLRLAMTPASYEDWLSLLDQFPGHVFEVSVYDQCLGDTPHRNALVWEVRRY